MKRHFLTACALATAGLFSGLALPAAAQDSAPADVTNGQSFGAWTVSCQALGMNKTSCVLQQQLLRSSDRAFLARLVVFWSADGARRFLAAQVPVGAYLPAGFALKAEASETPKELTWQSCNKQICEALIELDDATLQELSGEGQENIASYRPSLQADPLVFRCSMTGAQEGLAALKPAD
jgi:invasion protein IalB